jgi:hypothetical protein
VTATVERRMMGLMGDAVGKNYLSILPKLQPWKLQARLAVHLERARLGTYPQDSVPEGTSAYDASAEASLCAAPATHCHYHHRPLPISALFGPSIGLLTFH